MKLIELIDAVFPTVQSHFQAHRKGPPLRCAPEWLCTVGNSCFELDDELWNKSVSKVAIDGQDEVKLKFIDELHL